MTDSLITIVPEALLLATVCLMLLLGPFLVDDEGKAEPGVGRRWTILSLITLAIAAWVFVKTGDRPAVAGFFAADGLTFFVRAMTFTLGPVLALILSRQIDDGNSAEANACLLTILAGTNFVALSTDLIGLFLALELVSIPTYVFLYLPRRDAQMQEAALKYFLLSVFSSAFVLFGMSWLFGATGTTNLRDIAAHLAMATAAPADANAETVEALAGGAVNLRMVQTALAILIAGLSFRLSAVPFHFYAPDVFQGVNSASAAMLSFIPKAAGFAALMRVLPLAPSWPSVQNLLAVLAIVTMTLGNLLALRQYNLHRLLAYSSVAHSGYMLAGLAAAGAASTIGGAEALWFYLATYGVVTVGVFALLAGANADRPLQTDADLAGLSQTHPAIAVLLAVSFFSLTGLPPTAGFWGKYFLFQAGWSSPETWGAAGSNWWWAASPRGQWLAAAIAINAAVAAWYYLRLIAAMYREPAPPSGASRLALAPAAAGAVCAIASILIFAAPQRLLDWATIGAQ